MKKLKEALWADYEESTILSNSLEIGSAEYKACAEDKDKIRNELIKVEQIEADRIIKDKQIEFDKHDEKIKNGITMATLGLSVVALFASFRFDKEATFTSTAGKGIVNGIIAKLLSIFKR